MAGGGVGTGADRGEGEWLRAYGRLAAMVPRVEALAAGRARLEAVNALQHESWEARDVRLQWRLLKANENRGMWEAKCMAQQPSGDDRMFAELLKSDNEDLKDFMQVLELENEELKIRVKEVEGGAGHCRTAAGHEHIADLKAALGQLKQAYEALCSEKDKEVSALIAEKDLVREQVRTLERDYADLRSYSSKQAAQVTEAKQELEQLQVASQKKDDEIHKLQARAKAVDAKGNSVPEDKLQEMSCMPRQTFGEIEKCKDRQPETSQKSKKDNEQNANDEETSNQVLEPLKKKRVPGKGEVEVEQEGSKAKLTNIYSNAESNWSADELDALQYVSAVKYSFMDKPEKYSEFMRLLCSSSRMDVGALIGAIKVLFDGHPELIRGFKSFLPTPTWGHQR